jgi:hypothetical protein
MNDELYKDLEGRCPSLMQVVLDIAFRASEQLRKSSVKMAGPGEGTNRVSAEYEYKMPSLQPSARWRGVI